METENLRIAIAGTGMVGGALARYLAAQHPNIQIGLFDPPKGLADTNVLDEAEIIFLAVPTPYYLDGTGFDDSFLREVVETITVPDKIIVIKSTVLPGTTETFQKDYPQHAFLFNPEFLTEANADRDMQSPTRQIMGYTAKSQDQAYDVLELLPRAPYAACIPAIEAELVKYFGNAFLAMRVTFANHMYDICGALEANYQTVMEAAAADPRIGSSHLDVTHGGYRGYGGKCFPKDMRALIQLARQVGIEPEMLIAAETYNNNLIQSQGLDIAWTEGSPRRPSQPPETTDIA